MPYLIFGLIMGGAVAAIAHGKSVEGTWTIRVDGLPSGVAMGDVDDVFLLLNYEYAA